MTRNRLAAIFGAAALTALMFTGARFINGEALVGDASARAREGGSGGAAASGWTTNGTTTTTTQKVATPGITVSGAGNDVTVTSPSDFYSGTGLCFSVAHADCSTTTGPIHSTSSKTVGHCTLNGATPSVCTATVAAGTTCQCSPVGGTSVIAAAGCSVALSSTTLTITSGAALTNDVNYTCL